MRLAAKELQREQSDVLAFAESTPTRRQELMRLAAKELQREQSDVLAFADRNREIVELPEKGKISSEFNNLYNKSVRGAKVAAVRRWRSDA